MNLQYSNYLFINVMSIYQFYCETKAIVDFDFLESISDSPILKNATIFKTLFKIGNIKSNFKKEDFNPNLFIEFQIVYKDWNHFIYFLKHKIPLILNDYEKDAKIIENLVEICNKFGGITFLDNYLDNTDIKEKTYYNPQSPKEDVLDKYYWRLIPLDILKNILDDDLYSKWNCTTNILSINKGFSHLNFNFLRKPKYLGTEVKIIHQPIDKYQIIEPTDQTIQSSYDPTFNVSSFD